MKLLITFILLNIVNVCLQTANHIITVKCNREIASMFNALTFGVYTVVLVYMGCELPVWVKALTVAGCNFIGVFLVKSIEQKMKMRQGKKS